MGGGAPNADVLVGAYIASVCILFEVLSGDDSEDDINEANGFHPESKQISITENKPPDDRGLEVTLLDLNPGQWATYLHEKAEWLKARQTDLKVER
jgi:hypothetical protein